MNMIVLKLMLMSRRGNLSLLIIALNACAGSHTPTFAQVEVNKRRLPQVENVG